MRATPKKIDLRPEMNLDTSEFDEKIRTGAKRLLQVAKRSIRTWAKRLAYGARRLTRRVEMS